MLEECKIKSPHIDIFLYFTSVVYLSAQLNNVGLVFHLAQGLLAHRRQALLGRGGAFGLVRTLGLRFFENLLLLLLLFNKQIKNIYNVKIQKKIINKF